MSWVSSHPYVASSICALVFLFIGASVVLERSAATPLQYGPSTWSGSGGITATAVPLATQPSPQTPTPSSTIIPYKYVSPFTSGNGNTQTKTQGNSDALALSQIEDLLKKPTNGNQTQTNMDISDAYSFVPTGLISVPQENTDTDAQSELRSYGNDIGSIIQSFEQSNPDQPTILKNFMEDRNNSDKAGAMRELGAGLSNVGDLVAAADPVPTQMQASATALAESYREIGKLLAAIPDAKSDDDVYQAIVTYDSAAERFVGKFVNFALLFPASGVTFSPIEAGSVFMFQGSAGNL